ncbi:MAG TPA: Hsp20/alpha crystallin family protein [Candidatus Syntrophoarchaeum butanivorans]|uniref:Heat shock protein Hsp20 domain protein n=1 Tax=Candidatus Syntropharchaeum butanivorans TaxID=1839936 RepID=A0A1F2P325_9EURY|nr:MAG: Heat shock protein Hsp20 domain protein [Candidatus Syntrophoarchaeum butanivorans]HEC57215.1 Hsp20/alpha crystallin family protein [Candidatus Syntrophoarchaeum butanivorans]
MWRRPYLFDPLYELEKMERWMSDIIDEIQSMQGRILPERAGGEVTTVTKTPSIDLLEEDGKLVLKADMPGVNKEDITVNLKEDSIEISAERKEEKEEEKEGYIRRERSYAKYYRLIPLPAAVDRDAIEAKFENGVLEVRMPKIEAEEVKRIEVK